MDMPLSNLDHTLFRAYDIRGVVGEALIPEVAYHLGRAFAAEALANNLSQVTVAADGRLSSPSLKETLIKGLLHGGVDVQDIGYVPTPVLYFATYHTDSQTGIMITGSHNPANYNGFKMVMAGNTLAEGEIQALKHRMLQQDYSQGEGTLSRTDVSTRYRKRIQDDIQLGRRLKIVVDCGNGIAGNIAPVLLEQLGCEVIPLYCEVDGNFPNHHPDPGKLKNLRDCIAEVQTHGADIGLAFDGDGDRVGVVTASGDVIYPDRLMMLFAEDVLQRNPGCEIIYDVKCSRLLHETILSKGGKPTMWKTGHSLIKRKMKSTGALLAGEMSGHIFFKERWFGFDDGLYSAARLLEILANTNHSLDDIFSHYPINISTPELNIDVNDETKFDLVSQLQQQSYPEGEVSQIDGLRVDYPDGWGLVRASNTTPVLVLRFEATSATALARIRQQFQTRLLEIDPTLIIPDE
jgi:phosphomannomutase/phosphoglucomutase